MKTVEFELHDKKHYLCMNGAALFDCYDKFGTKGEVIDNINMATKRGFINTCWLLAKLSEQGAAVRKYMGLESEKPLEEEYLRLMLKPVDVLDAKLKIMEAVSLGFARSEEESTFDPWLAEIEQKKTVKSQERDTSSWVRRFLGFRRKK